MSFEKRLKAGIERITAAKDSFRVFDTANRVSRMLKRGLNTHTGRRPEKTPRQFISGAIMGHRALPGDGATIDGSCATILLAGMAAFADADGDTWSDFSERLNSAHGAMIREAKRRYREPRPGGIVFAVNRVCNVAARREPNLELLDDMINTVQIYIDPDKPDPGSVCLLRFLMGFREG